MPALSASVQTRKPSARNCPASRRPRLSLRALRAFNTGLDGELISVMRGCIGGAYHNATIL